MSDHLYRLTQLASTDIVNIWNSIAQDNLVAADRLIGKIHARMNLLAKFPKAGHARKDLAEGRPLLFSPVGNYMIVYQAHTHPILVVRILHAARNLSVIFSETGEL